MKRTTEVKLRLASLDYYFGDGLGLCKSFVLRLLKAAPLRILVRVRAIKPTQGKYRIAHRSRGRYVVVGARKRPHYTYFKVQGVLDSIGVAPDDKFWFQITAVE